MRRFPLKALFTLLNFRRPQKINWDRNILIFSSAVTLGLVLLYIAGKFTSRW